MNLKIKQYIARSWFHRIGANILCKQFSARSPNLRNAVALTFTIDRSKFSSPLEAWKAGVRRSGDFMETFRRRFGHTEYFIGLEFHRKDIDGVAWPHWHVILLRRGYYDKNLLEKWWGLGLVWVNRIRSDSLDYFLKYVTKCLEDCPEWVLPLNRIRRVRYSRHFLARIGDAGMRSPGGKRQRRAQRTIGERLDDWTHRCTIICGTLTTSAKTRRAWAEILYDDLRELADNGSYQGFGVLNIETTNQHHLKWIYKNLWVFGPLSKVTTDSACVAKFAPLRQFGNIPPPRLHAPPEAGSGCSMKSGRFPEARSCSDSSRCPRLASPRPIPMFEAN